MNRPHRRLFQDVASTGVAGSNFCNDWTFQDRRSEARTDISSISNHRITPHHRRIKFLAQRIPNIRQYVKVSLFIFKIEAEKLDPPAPTCILETTRCYVDWFIGKCGRRILWFVLVPPVKCRLIPWNGSWLTALLITEHTWSRSRLNRWDDVAEWRKIQSKAHCESSQKKAIYRLSDYLGPQRSWTVKTKQKNQPTNGSSERFPDKHTQLKTGSDMHGSIVGWLSSAATKIPNAKHFSTRQTGPTTAVVIVSH